MTASARLLDACAYCRLRAICVLVLPSLRDCGSDRPRHCHATVGLRCRSRASLRSLFEQLVSRSAPSPLARSHLLDRTCRCVEAPARTHGLTCAALWRWSIVRRRPIERSLGRLAQRVDERSPGLVCRTAARASRPAAGRPGLAGAGRAPAVRSSTRHAGPDGRQRRCVFALQPLQR